jgi:hypothetical protein
MSDYEVTYDIVSVVEVIQLEMRCKGGYERCVGKSLGGSGRSYLKAGTLSETLRKRRKFVPIPGTCRIQGAGDTTVLPCCLR